MKLFYTLLNVGLICALSVPVLSCSKAKDSTTKPTVKPPDNTDTSTTILPFDVDFWLTKGDKSVLLKQQNTGLLFGTDVNTDPVITVDAAQTFQTMDGFGFALTGSSAYLINHLSESKKQALLQELFSNDSTAISISYLRISLGASDLSPSVFSYDDITSGTTDTALAQFSIAKEMYDLVPILKKILAINPNIKILSCPWSAPTWMKTNNSFYGGSLLPQYYNAYARYFVKYIQAMQAEGIPIDAITPQNEPLNAYNNPSMLMPATAQDSFIKFNLGPAFAAANIQTKIIIYDHNCDVPNYPISILDDPDANPYIDGSAFHLYLGDISALTTVHNAHPDKNLYFTEQFTDGNGTFSGDLSWHIKNLIVGASRNWSKNVIEWNLAADANYGPHTVGGCGTCQGALTIGVDYSRNVSYYIIAHASKFVPAGSIRIASNNSGSLYNVAFKRPDGKIVLIVLNEGSSAQSFNIKYAGKWVHPTLNSGAVGTFIWQ